MVSPLVCGSAAPSALLCSGVRNRRRQTAAAWRAAWRRWRRLPGGRQDGDAQRRAGAANARQAALPPSRCWRLLRSQRGGATTLRRAAARAALRALPTEHLALPQLRGLALCCSIHFTLKVFTRTLLRLYCYRLPAYPRRGILLFCRCAMARGRPHAPVCWRHGCSLFCGGCTGLAFSALYICLVLRAWRDGCRACALAASLV